MKISIESVIDKAKFRLGLRDTTLADQDLEILIDEGARQMGNLSGYVISCTEIDIDCYKAKLPNNCTEIICFSFPSSTGCDGCCTNYSFDPADESNPWPASTACGCAQYYVPNRNVLTEFCGMGANACSWQFGYDTQSGYLIFPSTVTATSVTVWYRGTNEDENGIMVIDELDQRGLSAYAAFQYASSGQNIKAYQPWQIRNWNQEWIAQKNKRIAEDFRQDAYDHAWLWSAIARAVLVNPANFTNRNF